MAHHLIALLFFISTVHDLSRNETHAPRSPPPYTSHFLFPSPSVSCSAFFSPCPTVTFFPLFSPPPFFFCTVGPLLYSSLSLLLSLSLCLAVCVSLCCCSEHPPNLPSLTGSLFFADVPLVSGGLAGRQQK